MNTIKSSILIIITSLYFCNTVQAQSWYLTGKSENDHFLYFVDLDSIKFQGRNMKAWVWVLERKPSDGMDSFKTLSLYNCRDDKYKLVNDVVFLHGDWVSSNEYRDASWKPVIPGSMNAGVMDVLCKKTKHDPARNYKSTPESTIRKTWWNQW